MGLAPRLELRQSQSLVMTPQLQQAIKLLQMSNLELAGFVAAEIESNPLLETARRRERPVPLSSPMRATVPDAAFETAAAPLGLAEYLRGQIGARRATSVDRLAALAIIEELDEDGYLRTPLAEIARRHGLSEATVEAGLRLVQECEPTGLGARDLAECLALQLRERNRFDPAMQVLVERLDLLAAGRQAELIGLCGVDDEDFRDMLDELRALDPKPGLRFTEVPLELALPDVFVTRNAAGDWTIELNSETLPRVLVNNAYSVQVGGKDVSAKTFISECNARANWLVRSLESRARTILKVATAIVRHQERFFAEGTSGLRPLTQRAVAEALGLHESTVSRVTANKYLACDRGSFELRAFFTASIGALEGGEAFAAAAVQARIRALIEREPGERTLSDDRIVSLLNGEGIDIARRTVAKYREGMGIPSSVGRRRKKSALVRA